MNESFQTQFLLPLNQFIGVFSADADFSTVQILRNRLKQNLFLGIISEKDNENHVSFVFTRKGQSFNQTD